MSNYYISKCCGEQVDFTQKYCKYCPQGLCGFHQGYICQGCKKECEVTAVVDTPGGVPKDENGLTTSDDSVGIYATPPTLTQLKDEMELEFKILEVETWGTDRLKHFISSHLQKTYEVAEKAGYEKCKRNIGQLRQWLNEKDPNKLVTNEDIEYWLGLSTSK